MVVLHNFIFGGLTTKLALSWHWAVPRPDCTSIHFDFQTSLCATNRRMLSHCHVLEPPPFVSWGNFKKQTCRNNLLPSANSVSRQIKWRFPAFSALHGKSIFRHLVVLYMSFINQVGTDTVRKESVRATRSTPKLSNSARSFPLYIRKSD